MRMKDILMVLAGVFLSILVVCNLYAQPTGMTYYRFLDKLELTKKQRDKLADLRINLETEKINFHAELKKLKLNLCDYMGNAEDNLNKIEETYKKIAEIQTKVKMAGLKNQIAREKVLTKNQRKKLDELINEEIEAKGFKIRTFHGPNILYFNDGNIKLRSGDNWSHHIKVNSDN